MSVESREEGAMNKSQCKSQRLGLGRWRQSTLTVCYCLAALAVVLGPRWRAPCSVPQDSGTVTVLLLLASDLPLAQVGMELAALQMLEPHMSLNDIFNTVQPPLAASDAKLLIFHRPRKASRRSKRVHLLSSLGLNS